MEQLPQNEELKRSNAIYKYECRHIEAVNLEWRKQNGSHRTRMAEQAKLKRTSRWHSLQLKCEKWKDGVDA
jgi:hypothetical protein